MVLVLAGIAVGFVTRGVLADSLNTETAQHGAEICWPYCFSSTP
jgi:hypothetical protein